MNIYRYTSITSKYILSVKYNKCILLKCKAFMNNGILVILSNQAVATLLTCTATQRSCRPTPAPLFHGSILLSKDKKATPGQDLTLNCSSTVRATTSPSCASVAFLKHAAWQVELMLDLGAYFPLHGNIFAVNNLHSCTQQP